MTKAASSSSTVPGGGIEVSSRLDGAQKVIPHVLVERREAAALATEAQGRQCFGKLGRVVRSAVNTKVSALSAVSITVMGAPLVRCPPSRLILEINIGQLLPAAVRPMKAGVGLFNSPQVAGSSGLLAYRAQ
jgi:hypothetical protein